MPRQRTPGVPYGLLAFGFLFAICAFGRFLSENPDFSTVLCNGLILLAIAGVLILAGLGVRRLWIDRRKAKELLEQENAIAQQAALLRSLELQRSQEYEIARAKAREQIAQRRDIKALTAKELEQYAAELFRQLGYIAEETGQSGDHGIDVRLKHKNGYIEIVQCKQLSRPVGEPELQRLIGSMYHAGAVCAYFFAPSGFTQPARDFAAKNSAIVLCDMKMIFKMAEAAAKRGAATTQ